MAKKNGDAAVAASGADSIGQIREIILGEFIKASDNNFQKLESAIDKLSKEVDSRLSELEQRISFVKADGEISKGSIQEALDTSRAEIDQQVKDLGKKLKAEIKELQEQKVDRSSIGEVFIQWGQQVKTSR